MNPQKYVRNFNASLNPWQITQERVAWLQRAEKTEGETCGNDNIASLVWGSVY